MDAPLRRRRVARGTKVVTTTHDIRHARHLADEVAFVHRGRVTKHAPAAPFLQPMTPVAAACPRGALA